MGAGEHVDKVYLLTADDLRQPLTILMRQHVQIVVRQLVTQDVGPVLSTQNTDPHRRRGDYLTVKLLMLFQTLGVAFGGNKDSSLIHARQRKQRPSHQQVEQNCIHNQNAYPFQHHIDRQRVDDTQRRRWQAFFQHQLTKAGGVTKPRAFLHPVRIDVQTVIRPGKRDQLMSVFIQNGHTHRQAAWREEVFHADSLLNAQQRLQAVTEVNRRQRVEIAHAHARPLANPEDVIPALVLRRIAIFHNTLMQAFQRIITLDGHIAQAEVSHAEIFAANQEDAIEIVGGGEIVAPVAHKPGEGFQRPAPGVAHGGAVGVREQRLEVRHFGFVITPAERQDAVFRRQPVFGNILQLLHYIRCSLNVTLGLIGA